MQGLPRDVDELLRLFEGTIRTAVDCDERRAWVIAHFIWCRGVLAKFKPPQILTCDEAIAYLGIAPATWKVTARRRWEILPVPVEGSYAQQSSKYRFVDVERLFEHRDIVFTRTALRGFADPVIPGLDAFIASEAKRVAADMAEGHVFSIPLHLPQNPTQLEKAYSGTVAKVIRYRLKFGLTVEDAINDMWVKILHSNIVMKFVRSAPKHLPPQLSTDDVLDFFGIEWSDWQAMMLDYPGAPNPIKGAATSPDAVYRSEDIRALDESGYFRSRGVLRLLPAASVAAKSFEQYLQRKVENELKNKFRTLHRRFNREDTLGDGACLQENRRVSRVDRDSFDLAWEDTLWEDDVPMESFVDIARRARLKYPKEFGDEALVVNEAEARVGVTVVQRA